MIYPQLESMRMPVLMADVRLSKRFLYLLHLTGLRGGCCFFHFRVPFLLPLGVNSLVHDDPNAEVEATALPVAARNCACGDSCFRFLLLYLRYEYEGA
jgi:hypothetical protein